VNPQTMTCDECRDELARRAGWKHITEPTDEWDADTRSMTMYPEHWIRESTHDVAYCHPYPPTLDGAAGALPETAMVKSSAVCHHCSQQLGGSFPMLGSRCSCGTTHQALTWYRDLPQCGRSRMWGAVAGNVLIAAVPDTGDPITDLFRLALCCVIAGEGKA